MVKATGRPSYDADVIVAGAGPAGAAAALHLRRSGASVILLDRMTFPRDKVCGDFVGPAALIELDALGVSRMDGFAKTNIGRRGAIYVGGEEQICRPFPAVEGMPPYGRVIPRLVLDRFILEAARCAGARVMEGRQLVNITIDSDSATVHVTDSNGRFRLRGRLLIGADGASSKVARLMRGAAPPRRDTFIASRAYFTNTEGSAEQLDLYFGASCLPGYQWLFPTGNGEANVGLGIALESLPPRNASPASILCRLINDDPALAARLRKARLRGKIVGWPLITYNHRLPIVFDRALLIGDAAGLINPLNGEGIQYALQSARWAADSVTGCLRAGDFSARALAPFAARVERELRYDMALARLAVQLISNRALSPMWVELFKILAARARKDHNFANTLAGIFAGLIPARDVLTLIGGTVDQTARTLVSSVAATAAGGPRMWAGAGLGTALVDFGLAYEAAKDPASVAQWLKGAAASALELGWQASRTAIATAGKGMVNRAKVRPVGTRGTTGEREGGESGCDADAALP